MILHIVASRGSPENSNLENRDVREFRLMPEEALRGFLTAFHEEKLIDLISPPEKGKVKMHSNMRLLRKAGDFANRSVVEYATIRVQIPNAKLSSHLKDYHWEVKPESLVSLSVSPKGRLTHKELVLESVELAEQLIKVLHKKFQHREYRDCYKLKVTVRTSTATKMTTKRKIKHSAEVKTFLSDVIVSSKPSPNPIVKGAENLAIELSMNIGGTSHTYYVKHLTKNTKLSVEIHLHSAKLYRSQIHCERIKEKLLSQVDIEDVKILCLSQSELDALKIEKDNYMRMVRGMI